VGASERAGDRDSGRTGPDDVEPAGPPTPARDAKKVRGQDFRLTPEHLSDLGGEKTRARQNIAAIRVLREIQEERRPATREELEQLARYVGWGGIQNIFPTPIPVWQRRYQGPTEEWRVGWEALGKELQELLTEEEYQTARRSTQYAHYTSLEVVGAM
jgi:hypothetical protein